MQALFERQELKDEIHYRAISKGGKLLSRIVVPKSTALEYYYIHSVENVEGGVAGGRSLTGLHDFLEQDARKRGIQRLTTHARTSVAAFFARQGWKLEKEPCLSKTELLTKIAKWKKEKPKPALAEFHPFRTLTMEKKLQ